MAWTALVLVIAGLGYAFGVRSYLAWRATGDTGLRTATGPAGSTAWWAKLLFIASIVLLIAGPVTSLAGPGFLRWPQARSCRRLGWAWLLPGC